jgi:hypothetical protein
MDYDRDKETKEDKRMPEIMIRQISARSLKPSQLRMSGV